MIMINKYYNAVLDQTNIANHVDVDFVVHIGVVFALAESQPSRHFKLKSNRFLTLDLIFQCCTLFYTSPDPPAESK